MVPVLHYTSVALLVFLVLLLAIIVIVVLFIAFSGKAVPVPDISRGERQYGQGPNLVYVVLGDSTGVGQGAEYSNSIAVRSSQYVANRNTVRLTNIAVSGATTRDVRETQLEKAMKLQPDLVLIAVGANDVTHVTRLRSINIDITHIITTLRSANPDVLILLTGSPQMGSIPRFPWPINYFARLRTTQVNTLFKNVADKERVAFAPLAEKTGHLFDNNPELFAQDKFHPNDKGYATWASVINRELKKLLQSRTSGI